MVSSSLAIMVDKCCKYLLLIPLVTGVILVGVVIITTYHLGDHPHLSVGVLYDRQSQTGARLARASSQAVQDIFIEGGHQDPGIYLHTRARGETAGEAVKRMREEGVKVFIGLNSDDEEDVIKEDKNIIDDLIFLSSSRSSVHSIVPSYNTLSLAYLHLINTTTHDRVTILPVLRDSQDSSDLYSAIVQSVKQYPRIVLLSPVIYTTTDYPRSDAFQVISSIGQVINQGQDPQVIYSTQLLTS